MSNQKYKVALRNPITDFVRFFESSFEKKVGDKMNIEGKIYIVIALIENKAQEIEFITRHNEAVEKSNKIVGWKRIYKI